MNEYQEFNYMKKEIDNYTEKELINNYKILTGIDELNISIEEIKQYLKEYWKEQIYKDENIIVN